MSNAEHVPVHFARSVRTIRTAPRKRAAALVLALAASALIASCSQEVECGTGSDEPGRASLMLISAARDDSTRWACTAFEQDLTREELQQQIDYYKDFAQASNTAMAETVDQMGSGLTVKVTVADTEIEMEEYSTIKGRWFWKKNVYFASPVSLSE